MNELTLALWIVCTFASTIHGASKAKFRNDTDIAQKRVTFFILGLFVYGFLYLVLMSVVWALFTLLHGAVSAVWSWL